MPQELNWLPAVGSAGAALLVMWFFLQYIRKRDEDMKTLYDRMETITKQQQEYLTAWKTEFLSEIRAAREQNQQIVNSLLTVNRETVIAVSTLGQKFSEMTNQIEKLQEQVLRLSMEKKDG